MAESLRRLSVRININVDEDQWVATQYGLGGNFKLCDYLKAIPTLGGKVKF